MIVGMEWETVFEFGNRRPGCDPARLDAFTREVRESLTPAEVDEVAGRSYSPFGPLDVRDWRFPDRPLPASYLRLLAWSDGGDFGNGERWIQLFSTSGPSGVRAMNLAYELPYYLPGAVAFAFDGGGVLYVFDMRADADSAGEYPIVATEAGNLEWDDSRLLGRSFEDVCRGRHPIWE